MISILALLLAAHAIIDEIRLNRLRQAIRTQEQRIDGLLELIDGDGDI